MTKEIYDPIEKDEDDLGSFRTHKKLIRHILHPLKFYNFRIKQFFIKRIIQELCYVISRVQVTCMKRHVR